MDKYRLIQKKLDKQNPLFLSSFPRETDFSTCDIDVFILAFLTSFCLTNKTIDSVTKDTICGTFRRRSISDIYNLCRYYYDNVSFIEVQCILARLNEKKEIGFFYCLHTKKRVYMSMDFYKTHTVNPVTYAEPDEFGISREEIKKLAKTDYTTLL